MAHLNKLQLIGNLGNDPEVKFTPGGKAVARASLATTRRWKNAQGEVMEKTEWHRLVIWDKRGEAFAEYVKKGHQVYVEGRVEYGSYDKDGVTVYTTDVVVDHFEFLEKRQDSGQDRDQGRGRESRPSSRPERSRDDQEPPSRPQDFGADFADDDIPF